MRNPFTIVIVLLAAMTASTTAWRSRATSKSDSNRDLLVVVNKDDRTLSIVDPESGQELAAVPVGGVTGHEVAAFPDGRTAWVPIYGDSGVGIPGSDARTVSVIDVKSRTRIDSIDLGRPSRPHCAIFGPRDGRLYVTSELTRSIAVIDPKARKVIDAIPAGQPQSHMLALSGDGKRGHISSVGNGTVSVIDLHTSGGRSRTFRIKGSLNRKRLEWILCDMAGYTTCPGKAETS